MAHNLWASMKKFNTDTKLINIIRHLYANATNSVLRKGHFGNYSTKTGVR